MELSDSEIEKIRLMYINDTCNVEYSRGSIPAKPALVGLLRWLVKKCLTQQSKIEELEKEVEELKRENIFSFDSIDLKGVLSSPCCKAKVSSHTGYRVCNKCTKRLS